MQLSNYEIFCLMLSIFDAYIMYKFSGIFFDKTGVSKRTEIVLYTGYYLITSAVFLIIDMPFVLLISNFAVFVALTYKYGVSLKKRILVAALVDILLIFIEGITVIFSDEYYSSRPLIFHINRFSSFFDANNISYFYAPAISRIIQYITALVMDHYHNIKKEIAISGIYWLGILLIPSSSLYCYVILWQSDLKLWQVFMGIIMLLLINLSAIYLYGMMTAAFKDKYEKTLLSRQNEYYNKQLDIMKTSLKEGNAVKHDLKNHLSVIETLIQKNENEKITEHIAMVMDICAAVKEYACSGNVVIDSILNYKIQEAELNGIMVDLELMIPESLNVSSFDMTVILGNIMDNAIYATKKLEQDRRIDLKIRYDRGRILIKINNPFNGEVAYENNRITTMHEDKDSHGIGLNNVRTALEKYNGTMKIEHSKDTFSVTLLLFVNTMDKTS